MEKKPQIPSKERVPFREKLAFAAGSVGVGIQQYAPNLIITPIFVLGVGISPVWMSLKAVIERVYDAFTDLLMGWISDNTRSRWGRRKPYLLAGSILMGLSFPLMFFFDSDWNIPIVTAWILVFGLLLATTYTLYNIPHQALFLELTPNSTERTNVAAVGAYLGMGVQILVAWMWKLTHLPIFADELGEPDVLNGARWITSALGLLIIICCLMPVLFCRERFYSKAGKQKKEPLWNSIKLTMSNKPFLFLALMAFFYIVGLNIKWGLDFYTKVYYLFDGDQDKASTLAGIQGTVMIFTSMAGIPVFQWMARVRGKRFALNIAIAVVAVASFSTLFLYIPEYPYLSMVPIWMVGPAGTGLWVILPSMMGDVVDKDELMTGERREGSYSSVFGWLTKFAISAAYGLSGPIVVLAGFDVDIHREAGVPDDILWNMRLLLAFLPLILVGMALVFSRYYTITREEILKTKKLLEERRGEVTTEDAQ